MNENEINILEVLSNESNISQRDIARKTNLSLGMVNALIKKCVKKGFVKIENLNARSVKYILTPSGIEEKARKTLEYISKSYRAIKLIDGYIKEVTKIQIQNGKKIVVLGSDDEMKTIIEQTLRDMDVRFKTTKRIDDIEKEDEKIIYIWETSYENKLENETFKYINLLKER